MAWPLTDKFNSDTKSLGDLNGQDGWSGDTDFEVVNVGLAVVEGDQGIQFGSGGGSGADDIEIAVSVTEGTMYISMGRSRNNSRVLELLLYSGTDLCCHIQFHPVGNIFYWYNGGGDEKTITAYVANTIYRLGVQVNSTTDQYRCNVGDGVWGDWVTYHDGASGDIDKLIIRADGRDANEFEYFDWISPNYAPVAEGKPSRLASQMVG